MVLAHSLDFGQNTAAEVALQSGVALVDGSAAGRLELTGADCRQFLHNQTTNAIAALQPGQGCETVFVNSTARTLDLATVLCWGERLWVAVSPGQAGPLITWLDRYIFPMDRVTLTDLSESHTLFTLVGPQGAPLLNRCGIATLPSSAFAHCAVEIAGVPVQLMAGTGLDLPGYQLWVGSDRAATVWQALMAAGAVPLEATHWETLRIVQGRPAPGAELTEQYNPLEAGLWRAISFTKGCYIGQETIARLNTYQGVKQRLWQIPLSSPVAVGTAITQGGAKVGEITSVATMAGGAIALGYVKTKAGEAGSTVEVGDQVAKLQAAPYLSHAYYQPGAANPPQP
ncbi:folate-binding protein [Spirulina sp. CCNP1310]|uniref:CAF17-like 4Fe-4S cluster assembly/insertion protein YgfZ n=1 Tax=Spirulina sp. CCNP1310 TaxID=3110249 RepID=UPI002B1EE431|nr:folate-binding protein [Spirulina sp. CCNP1310]MEA5418447.1 folate-binding protein [Spirulina sp. CCNP1310]